MIDSSVYDNFSLISEELGLVRSENLENHMKEFIDKNKKVLDRIKNEEG